MNRLRGILVHLIVVLPAVAGCGSTDDDNHPPEPSDAQLEQVIEGYCSIAVPCYPGTWEEPEYDGCIAQQEEWAARSPECRKARYDFCGCIVELGSCEALSGPQPCRMENSVSSELRCDAREL